MGSFSLNNIDRFAGLDGGSALVRWTERLSFVFTVLLFLTAPHSIAASQTAWAIASIFWLSSVAARYLAREPQRLNPTFLLIPIGVFAAWTVITAFLSYTPDISTGKLDGLLLFIAYFLVVNIVRTRKAAKLLAFAIFLSCMVNVLWTPLERIPGRGVEVRGLSANGPLASAGAQESDTLLEVNGVKLDNPAQLVRAIETEGEGRIRFYRPDFYEFYTIRSGDLSAGETPEDRLGFSSWGRSRNWRSSGFYGMYATYAEMLVLLATLVAGLLAAALIAGLRDQESVDLRSMFRAMLEKRNLGLAFCLLMMGVGLLLTVTRAPQAAFLLGLFVIAGLAFGRKAVLGIILLSIPIAALGLYVMQSARKVTFFDPADGSTQWRQTVYREGIDLWLKNPRHFFLGVGMDSHKRFAKEWKLFDDGKLNPGHFHSNPIQLATERGLPALVVFIWLTAFFLWRTWKAISLCRFASWWEHGILLGGFAGMVAFQTSGLVHYNFGDSEVVMVLYLVMGLTVLTVQRCEADQKSVEGA
ncbi:MAG: O-antigen ligase family protein [Aridibacter famidurans]|nr:O-antigen ligase family protein [Aridibacter famidurans]